MDALRVADPGRAVAGGQVVGVEVDLQLGEADLEGAALAQLRVAGSTLCKGRKEGTCSVSRFGGKKCKNRMTRLPIILRIKIQERALNQILGDVR